MKMNKTFIVVAVVAIIAIMLFSGGQKQGAAGAVTRVLPATVAPNTNVQITVQLAQTLTNYFIIVRENIPSGWTYVSGGTQDGTQVKGFLSHIGASSMTYTIRSPASGTATVTGTYQFSDDAAPQNTIGQSSIQVCTTHSSYSCTSGKVYWFNSCNQQEDIKQDCGVDSCDAYGAATCNSLVVERSRQCYTKGCSGNACIQTQFTDRQTMATCTWRCTAAACMKNSKADSNANGAVSDAELLAYANQWISNTVTDSDLLQAAAVWLGQSEYPVAV